ncbi:hypothetical protein DL770_009673 [Monosporascus sp. CRB-9-2]|nr:hypothetical protein DL770_009673 [Monosporascus sp. CRB-9-2]
MLLFRRATAEAHWMQAAAIFGPASPDTSAACTQPSSVGDPYWCSRPFCAPTALSTSPCRTAARRRATSPHPSLHLAALRNRFDVIGALLVHGVDADVRESGICIGSRCRPAAGVQCGAPNCATKNALDVARRAGNGEMAAFLLKRGIEDLGCDCGNKGVVVLWGYRDGTRRWPREGERRFGTCYDPDGEMSLRARAVVRV